MDTSTAFVFRGVVASMCVLGVESLGKRVRLVLTTCVAVGALILSYVFNGGPLLSLYQLAVLSVIVIAVLESLSILWVARLDSVALRGLHALHASSASSEHDGADTNAPPTVFSTVCLTYCLACIVSMLAFPPRVWNALYVINVVAALMVPIVLGELLCVSAKGYHHRLSITEARQTLVVRVVQMCLALQWGFFALGVIATVTFDDVVGPMSGVQWTMHVGVGRGIVQLVVFPFAVAFGLFVNAAVVRLVFA